MKHRYNTINRRQALKTVTIVALGTGLSGRLANLVAQPAPSPPPLSALSDPAWEKQASVYAGGGGGGSGASGQAAGTATGGGGAGGAYGQNNGTNAVANTGGGDGSDEYGFGFAHLRFRVLRSEFRVRDPLAECVQ